MRESHAECVRVDRSVNAFTITDRINRIPAGGALNPKPCCYVRDIIFIDTGRCKSPAEPK